MDGLQRRDGDVKTDGRMDANVWERSQMNGVRGMDDDVADGQTREGGEKVQSMAEN